MVVEIFVVYLYLLVVCDLVLCVGGGGVLGKGDVGFVMCEWLLLCVIIVMLNLLEVCLFVDLFEGSVDQCVECLLEYCEYLLIIGGYGDESEVYNCLYSCDGSCCIFICQCLFGSYYGFGCILVSVLVGCIVFGEVLYGVVQSVFDYIWWILCDVESLGYG